MGVELCDPCRIARLAADELVSVGHTDLARQAGQGPRGDVQQVMEVVAILGHEKRPVHTNASSLRPLLRIIQI